MCGDSPLERKNSQDDYYKRDNLFELSNILLLLFCVTITVHSGTASYYQKMGGAAS